MYMVFNQRLAGYLMAEGFCLMQIIPNPKIKDFNVFCFNNSAKLIQTIKKYKHFKTKGDNQNESQKP